MAMFTYRGADATQLSMQEIANIPESVQDEMLHAGADTLIPYQQTKAREMGVHRTGKMAENLGKTPVKTSKKLGRLIHVYAQGSRKRGHTSTRNSEIQFINEFGKNNQPARPFSLAGAAAAEQAIIDAEAAVYDRWLATK